MIMRWRFRSSSLANHTIVQAEPPVDLRATARPVSVRRSVGNAVPICSDNRLVRISGLDVSLHWDVKTRVTLTHTSAQSQEGSLHSRQRIRKA